MFVDAIVYGCRCIKEFFLSFRKNYSPFLGAKIVADFSLFSQKPKFDIRFSIESALKFALNWHFSNLCFFTGQRIKACSDACVA